MSMHVYTFANMNGKQCQVTTSTELSAELLAKYKEALGIACTHTVEEHGNDIARPVVVDRAVPPSREYDAAAAHIEALEAALNEMTKAEHQGSDAYVRLRVILGALNTPLAPTPEQIHALTESKANALKTEVEQMTARCRRLEFAVTECHQQVYDNEYIDDLVETILYEEPSVSVGLVKASDFMKMKSAEFKAAALREGKS